jgi:hypothetical protein
MIRTSAVLATMAVAVATQLCLAVLLSTVVSVEADSVSAVAPTQPGMIFTGLIVNVSLLSPGARAFLRTAACTHGHEVHIHTSNRDDRQPMYNDCPVHVHEAKVKKNGRVLRIAVLRELMRDTIR